MVAHRLRDSIPRFGRPCVVGVDQWVLRADAFESEPILVFAGQAVGNAHEAAIGPFLNVPLRAGGGKPVLRPLLRCALSGEERAALPDLPLTAVKRAKEPEFVLEDRSAEPGVDDVIVRVPVDSPQLLEQRRVGVAGRQALVGETREEGARKPVAAFLGDRVLDHAATLDFRGRPGELVRQLGGGRLIHLPAHLPLPIVDDHVRAHPVVGRLGIAPRVAVRGRPVLPVAHPLVGDARNQQRPPSERIRPGQHVHHVPRRHELATHLLDVYQRRLSGHRDRLLELSDGQLSVHLQSSVADQHEAFSYEGLESG